MRTTHRGTIAAATRSIPSLRGAGKYQVDIQIGGVTVGTAQFDLR